MYLPPISFSRGRETVMQPINVRQIDGLDMLLIHRGVLEDYETLR